MAAAAMIFILRPYGNRAGIVAGVTFALIHGGDGAVQTGQRDLLMTVILLLACASLFMAFRSSNVAGFFFFGLFSGCSATVKPQAAFFALALFAISIADIHRRSKPVGKIVAVGFSGFAVAPIAALAFLWHYRAVCAFMVSLSKLDLYHASMGRHRVSFLVVHAIPPQIIPLALFALWVCISRRYWQSFEGAALLTGVGFGFVSFCTQGKAYPYHRYPLLAFLLIVMAAQIATAARSEGAEKHLAISCFLYGVLWIAPASTVRALRSNWRDERSIGQLQEDIHTWSGPSPQGEIQCMDTTTGCITELDRLHLVQATGSLYDCYLLAPKRAPIQSQLRNEFWQEINRHPPKLFIVTNQWCFDLPSGYDKLNEWPAFKTFLDKNYAIVVQRSWTQKRDRYLATPPFDYRIYSLRPSPGS
jgi:hypothetical protein